MDSGLGKKIAAFCCNLSHDDLPHEVVEKVKLCILHGVAVGLAATERPATQQALRLVKRGYTQKDSGTRLLIDGTRVPVIGATFANSVMLHSRMQEDFFQEGLIHLGVVVLPAALAVGEMNRKNGRDFITAIAAGYEVGARLARNYAKLSLRRGFRPTPLYGTLAAAIASAKLLNLEQEQLTSALGWAANSSGGLVEFGLAQTISEIPFQAAFASSAGVRAALLAQEGAVSAPTLLEGKRGFLQAFAGTNRRAEEVIAELGQRYFMLDTSFKLYPVSGLLQASVAAMLSLVQEYNIGPSQIRCVELRINPVEASYPGVDSMKPGPLSMQYCLSVAACDRKLTASALDGAINPCISNLMTKIKAIPDETILPPSCKLTVSTVNQGTFEKYTNLDVKGFNFDEEVELVKSLIPEIKLPEQKIMKFIEMLRYLEACEDITQLIDLVVPSGSGNDCRT